MKPDAKSIFCNNIRQKITAKISETPHSTRQLLQQHFSSCDRELSMSITLNSKLDLDSVKVNSMPNIQVSGHFIEKLLSGQTDGQTHRTNCSTWTTKVVGKKPNTQTFSILLATSVLITLTHTTAILVYINPIFETSGYATWFTAGGCNPHRSL